MREGDPADTLYVIGSGAVESYVYEGHRHQHHQHQQQNEHQSGALAGKGRSSSSIDEIDDEDCDDDYAMTAVDALPPAATFSAAATAAATASEKEFAPIVAGASPTNSNSRGASGGGGGGMRQSLFSAPDEIAMSVQKQRRQTVVMGPENQKVRVFGAVVCALSPLISLDPLLALLLNFLQTLPFSSLPDFFLCVFLFLSPSAPCSLCSLSLPMSL